MKLFLYDHHGAKWEFPAPITVSLQKDTDAPADSLKAGFPLPDNVPEMPFLCLEENGEIWFDGILDTVRESCGNRNLLTVSARSRAALLLDSESGAGVYETPNLRLLWETHAAPYGFAAIHGDERVFNEEYAFGKGNSEWQVLNGFCMKFLHQPLREENGILRAEPEMEREPLIFGKGGIPCIRMVHSRNPCRQVSEIWGIRQSGWQLMSRNAQMQEHGILRRRFCTVPESVMTAVEKQAENMIILCAGWQKAFVGQKVEMDFLGEPWKGRISQILYQLSSAGKLTRVTICPLGGKLKCGC